jgi:hypothetical protein
MMRVLVMFFFGLVLLIRTLVIPAVVFVTVFVTVALPFVGVQAVDGLQTPAVPHCMAGVQVSWAGTLKDLGVGILVVALGRWLDGIDGIVSWSVAALQPPKVTLTMSITIVVATVVVVVMPIIAVSIITPVVGVAILLVGSRSPANVFLDLLVSLISVCPLLCHRELVLD